MRQPYTIVAAAVASLIGPATVNRNSRCGPPHLDIVVRAHHTLFMRTTLNLDPDVLRAVRHLARERGLSLGEVVSELARRALEPPREVRYRGDFPVFQVREGAAPLTPDMVEEALDD